MTMIYTTTKQLNPHTIEIVQQSINREQIRQLVVDTTDRYRSMKFVAKCQLAQGNRSEWAKSMNTCKKLKHLLSIHAEWLHVSIYGYPKRNK